MWRTTFAAAAIDILAGLAALMLHSEVKTSGIEKIHSADEKNLGKVAVLTNRPKWLINLVLILFCISGFAALAYEILWTRLLVFFVSNNTYAFTAMLTIFLLGLALGSFIFERFFRKARNLIIVFVILEVAIGLAGLASIPILVNLRSLNMTVGWLPPFWSVTLNAIFKALAVMALPTVLIGIVFPLANTIYARSSASIGGRVGKAYAVNTVGSILGSIAAGFLIVPLLGTRTGIILIASLNIAVGLTAMTGLVMQRSRKAFAPAAIASATVVVLIAILVPGLFPPKIYARIFKVDKNGEVTYVHEGIGGTVTIEEFPSYRTISINGVNVAGTNKAFHTTQKLQAHLALLLHNNPRKVMQIGFGSGGTAYSASLHDVEKIDCVEISPVVLQSAPKFQETNKGVLDNPKVNVFIDDARSYMLHTDEMYDVILSDSTHPIVSGNGALYTTDYFRLCYNRLKPDGVFSTWLPLYSLRSIDYKIILKSLLEIFPHVYVWHTSIGRNEWTIVHGFKQPMVIDCTELASRISEDGIKQDLHEIYIDGPVDLLALFVMNEEPMRFYLYGVEQLNTDDNAYIEFIPTRYALKGSRTKLFRESFAELVHFRTPVAPFLGTGGEHSREIIESLIPAYASMTSVIRGRLYQLWNDFPVGRIQYQYALRIMPSNKVAADLLGKLEDNQSEMLSRLEDNPDDGKLMVDLGEYHFYNGNLPAALLNYQKAIKMQPDNEYAYSRIAHCHILNGDYDKAIETTQEWKRNTCLPSTDEAISKYRDIVYTQRALKYQPDDIEKLSLLARLYLEILDYDSSGNYITKGLDIDPACLDILHSMAFIQHTIGDKTVQSTCAAILEQDPSHPYALETLRILREGYSNPFVFFDHRRKQIERAESIQKSSKDRVSDFYLKAISAWGESDHLEAISWFEKAIEEDPSRREFYLNAAKICLFIEEYDRGIEFVANGLKAAPQDEELQILGAKLRFQKALYSGKELSAKEYQGGAMAYLLSNEPEEGFPYLMKAHELDPELELIEARLGSYHMITGQLEKAKELYEKTLSRRPDDERIIKLLEDLHSRIGEGPVPE